MNIRPPLTVISGLIVALSAMADRPTDPLLSSAPPLAVASALDDDGAKLVRSVNGVERPSDGAFFEKVSGRLQGVMPATKSALVCIQAGGGSGSGAIVSESGIILTAAHVVGTAGAKLTIVMSDGTRHDGEALGVDPQSDAGMARIINLDGKKFPYVPLGDYAGVDVGDWVFALGHSGGWDEARGSVVRLGRIVLMEDATVQSDCVLIGGDSGGPLFDLNGQLIGINSRVGMNVEFSMHVPVSVLIAEDELFRSGAYDRVEPEGGMMGFLPSEGDDAPENGVGVKEVLEGSPAEIGGLVAGDVIVKVDGTEVGSVDDIRPVVAERFVGERVCLELVRDGESQSLWVRLIAPPRPPAGDGASDEGDDEKPESDESTEKGDE